ncbi:tRNA uridine(34) 5-carboxymethylaminomethyl modification radical SAM/GNAT enzyme Elp3, partial [Candidatus Thorarchaeota archaeon]
MTEPSKCPHGRCAYCPGGPELGVPQSYTGHEPATMRGLEHDFDPFEQVQSRLNQLRTIGHSIQKVELIVMGGDWCSKDPDYRRDFVKRCFDAMNGTTGSSLEEAKTTNETADVRNVGLTFETRPDLVTADTIDQMLTMGGTRVEIGVQTLSDDILEKVQRGHGVEATARATKLLRDSGLKVCYHMMPDLPGSTVEHDLRTFQQLFDDERFRPDMLKIYPTIVVKNTDLYDWWIQGRYHPYEVEEIVKLIAQAVSKMPEYVRIQRMQRDIPLHQIEAGLDKGNLRELVHEEMERRGLRNPTIRFREIGHFQRREQIEVNADDIQLVRRDYQAGDGLEIFLSSEVPSLDIIVGFLRLRVPSDEAHRPEIRTSPCAMIRELRVYGPVVELGEVDNKAWQHLGIGEDLVTEASGIARDELDVERIMVNSGIGVKEYYRSLGFSDRGPYLDRVL